MALTETDLISRAEIQDALHSYVQAQDQDRWDLYDRVFTDDATIEFVGLGLGSMSAADLGRFLREDFGRTRISGQHLIANTLFDLGPDTARTVSEVLHVTLQRTDTPGTVHRSRGASLYVDDWVRGEGGWRIAHRTVTQKDLESDDLPMEPELVAAFEAGSRTDWTDPTTEATR